MVRAVIKRDKSGHARFESAEYMPHFTVPGTSSRDNFRVVLLGEEASVDSVVPRSYRSLAKAWLDAVIPVFNRHNKNVSRAK